MTTRPDYYRILQVHPDAHDEIIKVSYRTLMQRLKMHPDLGGDHLTATLINEAFRTLGHPERRRVYDQWLASGQRHTDSASAAAPGTGAAATASCPFCDSAYERADESVPDRVCTVCGGSLFPVTRHQTDEESRRTVERLPRNMLLIFARRAPDDAPSRGVTLDISLAGMRFQTVASVDIDDRLLIETEFCSAIGIVRSARQRGTDNNAWEIGVQFMTLRVKKQRGGLISTVA